jgi:hypothetical protein
MEAWILLLRLWSDGNVAAIPGYQTRDECEAAAVYALNIDSVSRATARAVCIPGPGARHNERPAQKPAVKGIGSR